MKKIVHFVPVLGLCALPFVTSCGGGTIAQRPDERPEPQQDPQAQMDAEEQRIREGREAIEAAGASCESRCHAGSSICDAAHRICAIAADLGDDRSRGRCDSAQASCLEANQSLTSCGCEPASPDAGQASLGSVPSPTSWERARVRASLELPLHGHGFAASCSSTDA